LRELLKHQDSWEIVTLDNDAKSPVAYAGEASVLSA